MPHLGEAAGDELALEDALGADNRAEHVKNAVDALEADIDVAVDEHAVNEGLGLGDHLGVLADGLDAGEVEEDGLPRAEDGDEEGRGAVDAVNVHLHLSAGERRGEGVDVRRGEGLDLTDLLEGVSGVHAALGGLRLGDGALQRIDAVLVNLLAHAAALVNESVASLDDHHRRVLAGGERHAARGTLKRLHLEVGVEANGLSNDGRAEGLASVVAARIVGLGAAADAGDEDVAQNDALRGGEAVLGGGGEGEAVGGVDRDDGVHAGGELVGTSGRSGHGGEREVSVFLISFFGFVLVFAILECVSKK